jgi:hypothetical protein
MPNAIDQTHNAARSAKTSCIGEMATPALILAMQAAIRKWATNLGVASRVSLIAGLQR